MFEHLHHDVLALFHTHQETVSSGLGLVREDMALESGDNLFMDQYEEYTEDEIATLNQEVTPAIEELLFRMSLGQSMQEITAWEQERAEHESEDYELVFNEMIDVQEEMSVLMHHIEGEDRIKKIALQDLDTWVKRYNTWKDSPKFKDYPHKKKAAKLFFDGLAKRKQEYQQWKSEVQGLWENWKVLKSESDMVVGEATWLWPKYFELAEESINPYYTNGDTEDVDSYELMVNCPLVALYRWQDSEGKYHITEESCIPFDTNRSYLGIIRAWGEYGEALAVSHVYEQREYEKEESNGIGFWDFKVARAMDRKAEAQKDEEDYLTQMVQQEPQEQYVELAC